MEKWGADIFSKYKKHEKSWVGDEGAKRGEKGHLRVGGKELLGGKRKTES